MSENQYISRKEHNELSDKVHETATQIAVIQSTLLANNKLQEKMFDFLKDNFKNLETTISKLRHDNKTEILELESRVNAVENRISNLEDAELVRKEAKKQQDEDTKVRLNRLTKWGSFMGIIIGILSIVQTLHLTKAWSHIIDYFAK